MTTVMITIIVASSVAMLPNSTLEMYIQKYKKEMIMIMKMMKGDGNHHDDDQSDDDDHADHDKDDNGHDNYHRSILCITNTAS